METPRDTSNHSSRHALRWLGVAATVLAALAAIVVLARIAGVRTPVFAFNLHFILMAAAAIVDKLVDPTLDGRRFVVSPAEERLYRRLGALVFMQLLRRIGWEAAMRDRKRFDGTRRTLHAYEQATRHGENAHLWLFVIVLAPIAWAAARGWWDAVCWMGSMSVVFHVYPILLQRTQRFRLTRMLVRGTRA